MFKTFQHIWSHHSRFIEAGLLCLIWLLASSSAVCESKCKLLRQKFGRCVFVGRSIYVRPTSKLNFSVLSLFFFFFFSSFLFLFSPFFFTEPHFWLSLNLFSLSQPRHTLSCCCLFCFDLMNAKCVHTERHTHTLVLSSITNASCQ